MIIDLLLGALMVVLMVPLLTGYAAYSHGRSFWLWFVLGLVLPVLSLAVLTMLIGISRLDKGQRLLEEARYILEEAEDRDRRLKARSEHSEW